MISRAILVLVLLGAAFAWTPALAADAQCIANCETQEQECSADAEQAIYDGAFSGHGCTGYSDCNVQVQNCRATLSQCKANCG